QVKPPSSFNPAQLACSLLVQVSPFFIANWISWSLTIFCVLMSIGLMQEFETLPAVLACAFAVESADVQAKKHASAAAAPIPRPNVIAASFAGRVPTLDIGPGGCVRHSTPAQGECPDR